MSERPVEKQAGCHDSQTQYRKPANTLNKLNERTRDGTESVDRGTAH